MAKIHGQLTGGKEQIKVEYEKNCGGRKILESSFILKGIKIFLQGQQVSGHTEMIFDLKSGAIDIRKFGSQGQQRTAALSLKLSEIRLIEQVTGEKANTSS